jgi:hypothetical protein
MNEQTEPDKDRIAKEMAESAASFIDTELCIMLLPDHDRKVALLHAHHWVNGLFNART